MNVALKIAIIESGRSQLDIAAAAKINQSTLSLIVRGWREPTAKEKKAIGRVLRRPPAQLFPAEEVLA